MIGYIYLTINDANDICYVGKRQKSTFDKSYKGSGTHLKLAFNKYGKDKFHSYILEWCDTKASLCLAEKKWISKFKEYGTELYNIGLGGDGGNMVDWSSLSKERRAEINKKNSVAHLGEKNGFYGKKHSERTRIIISESNKGRTCPTALREYKERQRSMLPKVVQLDKNTGEVISVWNNWCDAGKAVCPKNRCAYAHIGECCRHERKTAYGFKWEFAETRWTL